MTCSTLSPTVPFLSADTWRAIEIAYAEHRRADKRLPGSSNARDLECALDLLLAGSLENDAPTFRRHNAVRRARYRRIRAQAQNTSAAQRLAAAPVVRTGSHLHKPIGDPTDPPSSADIEQDVICRLLLAEVRAALARHRHHEGMTHALNGLLRGLTTKQIALETGMSAATVERNISRLREVARPVLAAG